MAAHQAIASTPLFPIGVPNSSPRRVSMTGVNGWYSANARSPGGIDSVGTKPLLRNGSRVRNIGVLLALSTLLAARPSATVSQVRANVIMAITPAAASQASGPVLGRNPTASATAV